MRDGRAPRGFAAASIKTPGLQGGPEERFAGYGVMGLPSRSGHYLALRHFPASSIGPGYRAVWHRDPHVLAWEVHLAATAATRLLSSASRLLPDRSWDMSTKAVISIAEIPGTLLAGIPVRLAGAR